MLKNLKDQKIISNIVENARIPISELAKKTKLSREVVQYRLKNLEKDIIAGYQARINLRVFRSSIYTLYLNIPTLNRKEIILRLKKLPSVHWIGSTLGRWNYIITFSTEDFNGLNKLLDRLFNLFENYPIKHVLTQQITEYKDSFSGLFGANKLIVSQRNIKKIKIDELDKKIIDNLTKNARMSNEEIANHIGLTRESVRLRIKNLEKNEVIINYRTLIKPQALNLASYFIAIKIKTYNTKELAKLSLSLANNKLFSYVCVTSGDYNIIGVLTTNSIKELDEIVTNIRNEFPELIDEIESFPLIEVGGQEYLPK